MRVRSIDTIHPNEPLGRLDETTDQSNESGLTAAVRAADEEKFAFGDRKADALQGMRAIGVSKVKVSDFDHRGPNQVNLTTSILRQAQDERILFIVQDSSSIVFVCVSAVR
jgi:hypothetical protein